MSKDKHFALSRRRFLTLGASSVLSLTALAALGKNGMGGMGGMVMPAPSSPLPAPSFSAPLPIPPQYGGQLAADGVREFHLHIAAGVSELSAGLHTPTWGYNGALLGPALLIPRHQPVRLWVHNTLQESTTTHWHGAHVPGSMDGGPQSLIRPGKTWRYDYQLDQPEATLWYHPHPASRTGPHVYAGLAGLYLVQDGTDAALGLPRSWGVDDIPVIVQDRVLDDTGTLQYMPTAMDVMGMKGNRFLINGREAPVFHAPAQWLRMRMLNASNARLYNFAFSDDREFYVIASDAGYLAAPVAVRRLLLAPAERAEILIDLRGLAGKELYLRSDSGSVVPALSARPMDSDAYDRSNFPLLAIRVGPPLGPGGKLPDRLAEIPSLQANAQTRQFVLRGMAMQQDMPELRQAMQQVRHAGPGGMSLGIDGQRLFSINNRYMDMQVINEKLRLGSTEIWQIENRAEMAHTFHVHGTSFQILSRNGAVPPATERGWKDTLLIRRDETVRFIAHYAQPATEEFPYMYHCHMLEHEDNGMMGQFTVT
jgi:blue copper oxidase